MRAGGHPRVVHVSTWDIHGGAARAAHGLHRGLRRLGMPSVMFVARRSSRDDAVHVFQLPRDPASRLRRSLRRLRIRRAFARYHGSRPAGLERFTDDRTQHGPDVAAQLPPCDVLHLHWTAGFVSYESFFRALPEGLPVFLTLHDMNPLTGGCHYDDGCGRFTSACGACPQLGSSRRNDLSRRTWHRKEAAYGRIADRLHLVTSSEWLAGEVRRRGGVLGRVPLHVIPYGLDVRVFAPRDRAAARSRFGLPEDARVALFVATSRENRRKGFALLAEALSGLSGVVPGLWLLSVGGGEAPVEGSVPHVAIGHVADDDVLADAYSAADAFVLPSLQEAFGLVVIEAMACGTPVAAFDVGGVPEIVRPGLSGALAAPGDAASLRDAIASLLCERNDLTRKVTAESCRRVAVSEYALELQAARHIELYAAALADRRSPAPTEPVDEPRAGRARIPSLSGGET